jgi:hypothetical protein
MGRSPPSPQISRPAARKVIDVPGSTSSRPHRSTRATCRGHGRKESRAVTSIFPDVFALRVGVTTVVTLVLRPYGFAFEKTIIGASRGRVLAR